MKYGLVIREEAENFNIGDDIWAYAAFQFLPHCDYLINRLEISRFQSKGNEDVAALLSGFLMPIDNEHIFFPSNNIIPKIISFHCRFTAGDWLAKEKVTEYLQLHGPVGARDTYSMEQFDKIGVKSYFSSCITTTLKKPEETKLRGSYICLVDVTQTVVDKITTDLSGSDMEIRVMSHLHDNRGMSWEKRIEVVEQYLELYAGAHCVITSRLHAALPCLALETPVLTLVKPFKKNDSIGSRFLPYLDTMLHWGYVKDFLSGQIPYDIVAPPNNKEEYLEYRNLLGNEINDWIQWCEAGHASNNLTDSQADRDRWLIQTYSDNIKECKQNIRKIKKKLPPQKKTLPAVQGMKNIRYIILDVDGTLTDGRIIYDSNGVETKEFSVKDGIILKLLPVLGIKTVILTGRKSSLVERRAAELDVADVIQGASDKHKALQSFVKKKKLQPQNIAYIGDDLNDFAAMSLCGYRACPADAAREIADICNYISPRKGGDDAVRDIIEHILKEQGKWTEFLRHWGA